MALSVFSFQSQLVSIMDALSKTAVMEISKLVEIESKMLKIEINRGRNEISSLTEKLQLMEKLMYIAQERRQDSTAAAACSIIRENPASSILEQGITRHGFKSETPWKTTSSLSETSISNQEKEQPTSKVQTPLQEHHNQIVVKEELSEVEIGDSELQKTMEKRKEAAADTKRSSDVTQSSKPFTGCQQPTFVSSIVNIGTQPSLPRSKQRETQRNGAFEFAADAFANNVATQSLSLLRNMKIHNLRNSAAKRFGCLQCGKNFRCYSQLEIHQRSHTGEKPYRCTLCGKRYAQKGHLYTHQRTHTGEKPYRCPICGKGFIQKCTLDMHQRTHTGERPFVCIKCGKGFTKNCNLKKHLLVHLEPGLNMCDMESDSATFSATLIDGTI